jgi:hypothetical protein
MEMKSIRGLCALAGVAVVAALLAAVGAGSASADMLCKVNERPCAPGNRYATGTTLESTIKEGTSVTFSSKHTFTCEETTMVGELSKNESGSPIGVTLTGTSFNECGSTETSVCKVEKIVLQNGQWIAEPGPSGNGTAGETDPVPSSLRTNCAGGILVCDWEYLESVSHTFTGGESPIESWRTMYVHSGGSFVCGNELFVEGEREFTAPSTPLYWTEG